VCITPKELLRGVYYTIGVAARCVLHREEGLPVSVGHRSRDSSKSAKEKFRFTMIAKTSWVQSAEKRLNDPTFFDYVKIVQIFCTIY
jgi:hypothetical protein